MGLENVKEWLHYCGRCNSCKYIYRSYEPSCPAFEKFKWESYTSSGKVWMARDLYEGKYELSESIRDKIFSCTLCGNCTVQCQQEVSNHALDIFESLREECIDANLVLPAHQLFRENIEEYNNPYGEEHENRWEGVDEKYFKESAEILFFVGCTSALRNKELFHNTLKLLDVLGVNFTLSKDEWCCGSPLLTTGQHQYSKFLAEHNSKLIQDLGVESVITACAGCFRTLKSQYPTKYNLLSNQKSGTKKSSNNDELEILHISQLIDQIISKKQFATSDGKQIFVTYHDPCHLGRHVGIFEEPRSVLRKLKGISLVEMPRNRNNAWCCGAGAGVKSSQKDWALEISEARLLEALNLQKSLNEKISYMVSTCPFCERNLTDARKSLIEKGVIKKNELEIVDLVQLILKLTKNT